MYQSSMAMNSYSPKRKSHGFNAHGTAGAMTSRSHSATQGPTDITPMASSSYIDMDLLLNDDLWGQFHQTPAMHPSEHPVPHPIPVSREMPEVNPGWKAPRDQVSDATRITPMGMSAPATQQPYVYEKEAWPCLEQGTAYSLNHPKGHARQNSHGDMVSNGMHQNMPGMEQYSASSGMPHRPGRQRVASESGATGHGPAMVASESAPAMSHMMNTLPQQWGAPLTQTQSSLGAPRYAGGAHPYAQGRRGDWPGSMSRSQGRSQTSRMRPGRSNSELTECSDLTVDAGDTTHSDGDNGDDVESVRMSLMSINEMEARKLSDKRRKRRESHNAVERRRRDNINSQITELATLLPENMLLDAITGSWTFGPDTAVKVAQNRSCFGTWRSVPGKEPEPAPPSLGGEDDNGIPKDSCLNMSSFASFAAELAPVNADNPALAAAQAKPNKGIILRKSVEYIRQLQQFLDMQMNRNSMLEWELRQRYTMQRRPSDTVSPLVADQGSPSSIESHERPDPSQHRETPPTVAAWNMNQKAPAPHQVFNGLPGGITHAPHTFSDDPSVIKLEQEYYAPVPTN